MPMETIINKAQVGDVRRVISDETLAETGFYWRQRGEVKILVCRPLEVSGFANGFSTRLGGVSPFPENALNLAGFDEDTAENIHENRRRFLEAMGGDFRLATVWQVHGDTVKAVRSSADAERSEDRADALVSDLPGILGGVKTADCVPVLIADPANGAFAAVHAGWRGTVQSIIVKAVGALREEYDSKPSELICAIGPAAGCSRYEIGRDVIDAFSGAFPEVDDYFVSTRPDHALVDLHLANRRQLVSSGVQEQNIYTAPFCTIENSNLFFSYRIEKTNYGKTGRLLSVIGRA